MKIGSPRLIGTLAYYLGRILLKTLKIEVHFHPNVNPKKQYVYGFWHDKQLTPIMMLSKIGNSKQVALVSASRDGDMLATWLKRWGYHVIQGSSSRKAISSLVKLIAAAREGYTVGIAADGPRGPCYQAKAGVAYIAQRAGLQIVPLGTAYSRKWIAKNAWDKYQFPLPFSKVVFYFSQPFSFTQIDDIDQANAQVTAAINQADEQANQILKKTVKNIS